MEENFHSGHVGDVESLEHDVRYALAEHEEDAVSLEHDVLAGARCRQPKPRPREIKSQFKNLNYV